MNSSYKDLKNLSLYIDNQKAFERHKKHLDQLYSNLQKKSVDELGFNNKAFDVLQNKIKNVIEIQKFNDKEKNIVYLKENNHLGEKIDSIKKRKNVLISNSIDLTEKNKILRKRVERIKSIENDRIRKANEQLGKRIKEKSPVLNLKKYNEEYEKTLYYKPFNRKFELPKIQVAAPIVVKRKLDLSPYNRAIRLSSINSFSNIGIGGVISPNFINNDKSFEEFKETFNTMKNMKSVKKNYSQEDIYTKKE